MKAIALNGYQIHSWVGGLNHGVQIPVSGLGFPDIRTSEYAKPGEYGEVVSNVLYSGRQIIMKGWTFGNTASQYWLKRRELESYLTIQKDSNTAIVPISLTFTTLDDLQLQANCYLKSFVNDVNFNTGGEWTLELICPDYFLSGQTLLSGTVTRQAAGGVLYPVVYPAVYSPGTGGSIGITNNGTAESFPIIYLNGPLTNPLIQNNNLSRYIQLNLTLVAGDQVVIDMKNKTAKLNGTQSVNQNIVTGSNFWWLNAGSNTISFQSDSVNDTGNAQVTYYDSYIGI